MSNREEQNPSLKILFSTRIEDKLWQEFKSYCKKHKRSISGQLELILEDFLEKNKNNEVIK